MIDARDTLATLMRDGGYKQTAIAQKAGLSSQQLTDIIKKRRRLDANEMFRLCGVLNVTPNELFGIETRTAQARPG